MGVERKSLIINDEEKRATAFHEAGHALVAVCAPEADPVHKVTIIPRGRALGLTQQLPIDDRHTYSKVYLESTIAVLMGGRVAEELQLDRLTTGAGNDFERSTEMARKMVTEWGMSEEVGPLTFGKQEEQIFLGREISQHRDYSEATAILIDKEVRRIVMRAYDTARRILEEKSDALVRLAEALLVHEVLDAPQIAALVAGEPMPEPRAEDSDAVAAAVAPTDLPPDEEPEKPGDGPSVLPEPGNQPA